MYENELCDRMVFFTDFNINPILLLSKKFTHAQMKNKPKSHSSLNSISLVNTSSD